MNMEVDYINSLVAFCKENNLPNFEFVNLRKLGESKFTVYIHTGSTGCIGTGATEAKCKTNAAEHLLFDLSMSHCKSVTIRGYIP